MDNNRDGLTRKVMEAAHKAWERMGPVRARRRRYARYTYGDQWSDPVTTRDGAVTTEREKALAEGRTPLTNNLIRRLVKAVVGRWRMDRENAEEETGGADNEWRRFNNLDEMDARTLEEFLISGMAIHRVVRERRHGGEGVWVDNISPERFFISRVSDGRCRDMEMVGCVHDMSLGEVVMRFSHGDRQRGRWLRELYGTIAGGAGVGATPMSATGNGESFYQAPEGRCRVIEVWTLECREALHCHDPLTATLTVAGQRKEREIAAENRRRRRAKLPEIGVRWQMTTAWHCRMIAPDGTLLDEFDSPLRGGEPPFAVKLYPMVDGDVHPLVEDVIDQQRYVNRLISLTDKMMTSAAKGVLLYPTGCRIEGQSWRDISRMWSDPDGVIPYKPHNGAEPHQVITPAGDIGARDMLATQMKMFEEVSGISDALLGKAGTGTVGVERYESQVRNATVAVCDLLKSYGEFVERRNELIKRA